MRIIEGVSSDDSVGWLKLRVWQVLTPEEADEGGVSICLFWKGVELREGGRTLQQAGVTLDGVVYARVGRADEGEDVLDDLSGDLTGRGGRDGGKGEVWEDPAAFGIVIEEGGREGRKKEGEGMERRLIDVNKGFVGHSSRH